MGTRISGEIYSYGYYETRYAQQAGQSTTTVPVGTYYNAEGSKADDGSLKNLSTYEAMALLNAKQKPKADNDKKIKAQAKLEKLAEKLKNDKSLSISDKQQRAMLLIENNPSLSSMMGSITEKLQGAFKQQSAIMETATGQISENATAEDILNKIKSIESKYQQLIKDWKAITKNLVIAGANSEAMLKVNDQTKKDKYYQKAMEAISQMPDAYQDKNKIKENAKIQAEENAYNTENTNPMSSEENKDFNLEEKFEQTGTSNPFEETSNNTTSQTCEITGENTETAEVTDKNDSPSESNNSLTSMSNDNENIQEVSDLKQEVGEEQIKQKGKNQDSTFDILVRNFRNLPSLLGL